MKVLYIGAYSNGSTSRMRAETIKKILSADCFKIIDIDVPKNNVSRVWRSIGFRYKIGPLIDKVNGYVLSNMGNERYDLIWVDKAIYLTRKTTEFIRLHSTILVHYTPDPAFTFHKSHLFYQSLPLYDFVVTTKSFEIADYVSVVGDEKKVLYATQGYDKKLHRPLVDWESKKGVAFIGHYEKDRERVIEFMLKNNIYVTLAGIGWSKFAKTHRSQYLRYLGSGVYGEQYVHVISGSLFAWGAISKWIPEKHTTRTFEIPACGTALLTERNSEIETFFKADEVIYYSNAIDLVNKIKYYDSHRDELKQIVDNGYRRVSKGQYDYESIIKDLLQKIGLI